MMTKNITRKFFESMNEFSTWSEETENEDNIVSIVEEGGWYRVDLTTYCARPTTAIRRLFAQVSDIKDFEGWEAEMTASVKDGYYHLNDHTMGDGSKNEYPMYSWGVEMLWDKEDDTPAYWYVFINIRSDADRERIEAEQKAKAEATQKAKTDAKATDLIQKVREYIDLFESGRSAWDKGVRVYADELLDELLDAIRGGWVDLDDMASDNLVRKALLNGASDWREYSWGGCSLIYDGDIAERLCTPSELKRTKHGERRPNGREEWLDVQHRALSQASGKIRRGMKFAIRRQLEKEVA